jgi:hypothetical protein
VAIDADTSLGGVQGTSCLHPGSSSLREYTFLHVGRHVVPGGPLEIPVQAARQRAKWEYNAAAFEVKKGILGVVVLCLVHKRKKGSGRSPDFRLC